MLEEYKIEPYTIQMLDNRTLLPIGRKQKRYSVYKKECPFPNKSIHRWEKVKDGFKTKKQAEDFLKTIAE